MKGQIHVCTVVGATTLNLPTAAVGYHCTVYATLAQVINVDVKTGTDVIILAGTALTAGNKATSDGTINAMIYCECLVTGKYVLTPIQGVWADGS
jgi:hypothetical protein